MQWEAEMTFHRRSFKFPFLLVLFFSFIFDCPAASQVYKWTDGNGNLHFTDTPPAGTNSKKILEERTDSKKQAKADASPGSRMAGKRDYHDIQVKIYTTSWCPYCKQAKEYLNSLKVNYTEYDIEKDADKAAEFKSKGGGGVPLVDIEGIIIKGYSLASIKSALDTRKKQ